MARIVRDVGVAACVVLISSAAYGQQTVHDCFSDYAYTGLISQVGNGAHQRAYQPMPVQTEPYTTTHITAILSGISDSLGAFDEADFIGRTITIEFLFGEYDDVNDVFVEDTSLPRPAAVDVVLTAEMLSEAAEDPVNKEQFDIDVIVPVPTGKQLHIALIAHFDLIPDNESFAVPVSTSCSTQESAWYVQPDEPGQPHGRANDLGLSSGVQAMRVTAQIGIAVPSVSTWGVVAMTLLMLTAGTLVCRSRMAKPVVA